MNTRRNFLKSVPALAALPSLGAARKPNILWLMADDLGYADVGCYGHKIIRTPNIDSLARDGTRFTDAYAGCTVCAPSRSVLMTGLHMGHTSVRSNPGGVPLLTSDVTVAEVLRSAGYASGLFGKWGLGDIGTETVPTRKGFDEFLGFLHKAHAHFQYPRFLYHNEKEYPLKGNSDTSRVTYANDVMAARSLDFIRRHRNRPFFGYFSYTIPHWEPHAPEDSMAEYRGKFPEDFSYQQPNGRLAPQATVRAAHAAMISRLDRYVGEVLKLLRALNLERDTIVFFTSDNGRMDWEADPKFGGAYGAFRGAKGNLYEGGIKVQMLVRWPGRVPAGKVSSFPWYFADFLPTAAEIAGARSLPKHDGFSVLPTLLGKQQTPHDMMYWELPRYNGKTGTFNDEIPMQAIRRGRWKAVRPKPNAPVELYDLEADPNESRNLAAENPKMLADFERALKEARVPPRPQKEPPHPWWEARS